MAKMNTNTMAMIVKTYEHDGQMLNVSFTEAGFFNATAIAKTFGKQPRDWLTAKPTQDYIGAIKARTFLEENQLVKVVVGGNNPGTWLHPKLGVSFARWCNVDFAVWADEQIEDILKGQSSFQLPKTFSEALQLAANQAKQIEEQQKQLAAAKPMIEFHEEVSKSSDEMIIGEVCASLFNGSVKEKDLRNWMKMNGWLDKRVGVRKPTKWAIDRGYMRSRLLPGNDGRWHPTPVVCSLGFTTLRHLYRTVDLFLSSMDQVRCLPQPEYRV